MNPIKVYPKKDDAGYPKLLEALQKEKSLLGSDTDKDGKFYLIIDIDCSPIIQAFAKKQEKRDYLSNPNNWTTKCSECGATMHYSPNTYTYYCNKCGNTLEV